VEKNLYRSRSDRIIFGVCGGLARYFNIDSTIIRLIFIVGAFLKGATILIYIILAIITPEEGRRGTGAELIKPAVRYSEEERRKLLALVLILVGAFFLISELIYWFADKFFAIILILIGIAILLRKI